MNVVVYTAITGAKDTLKDDQFDDGSDYICFTDNGEIASDTWTIKPACNLFTDANRNAKIHKVLSHQYVGDYDYSIWIDGNINLICSPVELIKKYLKRDDIAVFGHFQKRNGIYEEADICIRQNLDSNEVILEQMSVYKERNYPKNNGLFECTIILRKHTKKIERINNWWWAEICRHSKRDQLSFNYVLHNLKIKPQVLQGDIHKNDYFLRTPHDGHMIGSMGSALQNTKYKFKGHPKVSIIVLVRNELEYIKKCFNSLYKNTSNYELIVVDNGAGEATKGYLESLKQFDLKLIKNKENKGFPYGCNQAIKIASSDYICFLNSDTVVTPGWLDKLMFPFRNKKDCGITGPSTSLCGGNQCIRALTNQRYKMSVEEINAVADRLSGDCIHYDVMGFCFVTRKELFDIAGGFDYKKFKLGCTEEREWIWRAKILGKCKSYWVKDAYVHHYGHIAFDELGIDIETYNKEARAQWESIKDTVKPEFVENDVPAPRYKMVLKTDIKSEPPKKIIDTDNVYIKYKGKKPYNYSKVGTFVQDEIKIILGIHAKHLLAVRPDLFIKEN